MQAKDGIQAKEVIVVVVVVVIVIVIINKI